MNALARVHTPATPVAQCLGCHPVAAWAAHSQPLARARAALPVAPPGIERQGLPPQPAGWRCSGAAWRPFALRLLDGEDDPVRSPSSAFGLSAGADCTAQSLGTAGRVNGDSDLGDWPAGRVRLQGLPVPADTAR